jgi:hypothetical protein
VTVIELVATLARVEALHGPAVAEKGLRACRLALARVAADAAARRHPPPRPPGAVVPFPLARRRHGAPDHAED